MSSKPIALGVNISDADDEAHAKKLCRASKAYAQILSKYHHNGWKVSFVKIVKNGPRSYFVEFQAVPRAEGSGNDAG